MRGQVRDLDVQPLGAQQPQQHGGEVGVGAGDHDPARGVLGEYRVEVAAAGASGQDHGGEGSERTTRATTVHGEPPGLPLIGAVQQHHVRIDRAH